MKPSSFEAQNVVLGKGQPEYLELPALACDDAQGTIWSCWELDDNNIADIIKHRKIWVGQLTFKKLFAPQLLTTQMPLEVSVATHKARQKDQIEDSESDDGCVKSCEHCERVRCVSEGIND